MTFHWPHILWLLVPLVLLFSWDLARHTANAAAARWPKIVRAWAGARSVSLGARHSTLETRPRLWLWFGLAACLVALARPQWGLVEEPVFDQAREVLLAVDLSKSMLAQDVKPARLERAKLLIQTLLDKLKGERVGLVVFSGTAFLQSPLSADYEILREFLPALDPGYLPEGGTDYRALLETCVQAFGTSAADRYLIVLSDGEATDDGWRKMSDTLKEKGIRVIALGVGTAQGSLIPDGSGGFLKDERGAVVMSRLNSSTLQELAQLTGGAYADASAWVDLSALLQRTVDAGRKGEFREMNAARKLERFQWFLAPGLLLLFISFWSEFPVRPRERALPLGGPRWKPGTGGGKIAATTATALALVFVFGLSVSTFAAEDSFAAPLAKTVTRLADQPSLSARDCEELAETTLTYGERMKSSQQTPPEGAVRDALAAVDLGEKLDRSAAQWPALRSKLEALLQKQEQQKQDQKKQDQQQQQKDQQQNRDQKQDRQQNQNQQQQDQQNQQQQQDRPQNEQQQQRQQNQQPAFGEMKEKPQERKTEPEKASPPSGGMQKVGGQQEKPRSEEEKNPELAVPLQKLDQVRNQDSPVKLYQLLEDRRQEKPKTGKNW